MAAISEQQRRLSKIGNEITSDAHLLPATNANYIDGLAVFAYMNLTSKKLAPIMVTEIYNFNQDDLMAENIFVLDCHSDIFVWVERQVDSTTKIHALSIGEGFASMVLSQCFVSPEEDQDQSEGLVSWAGHIPWILLTVLHLMNMQIAQQNDQIARFQKSERKQSTIGDERIW
ncbi:unnamed protein product [Camellia sinensis]